MNIINKPLRAAASLGVLCALFAAGAAQAQQSPFYVGAAVGGSRLDFDFRSQIQTISNGSLPVTRANLGDKQDTGFKLTAGYQALPWLAVELDYVNLGEFGTDYELNGFGRFTRQGRYEVDGWNIAAVFANPINDRFTVFGKVGAFHSTYKYSESGENFPAFTPSPIPPIHAFQAPDLKATDLSYGLGLDYALNKQASVRLAWDRYTRIGNSIANDENRNGKFDNIDLVTVGVVWRF